MARQSGKGEQRKPSKSLVESVEVLRAKYMDYCSARVCDVFMELEEEQVFDLARAAERKAGADAGQLNFRDLANLRVDKLLADVPLPDFETWSEDYQRNPERYDPYLLGLWKNNVESPATSP